MLRDAYFQSSENPTQVDRLPAGKTALRFLCRSLDSDAVRSAWGICPAVAAGSLIRAVTIHALRGLAGPALANVMLVISTLMLSGGLLLALKKPTTPLELRQAVLFSAAAVMVWCHLNFTIAQELQAIVAAAMLGFVSFSIGEHWIAVCTASPMSRSQADTLRSQYVPFLMVMSALPTLFVLVAIAVGSLAVALVGLVILAVYQMVDTGRLSQGRYGWFTPLEAVRAWFAPDGKDLPGFFQSPSGPAANRFGFVVLVGVGVGPSAGNGSHDIHSGCRFRKSIR